MLENYSVFCRKKLIIFACFCFFRGVSSAISMREPWMVSLCHTNPLLFGEFQSPVCFSLHFVSQKCMKSIFGSKKFRKSTEMDSIFWNHSLWFIVRTRTGEIWPKIEFFPWRVKECNFNMFLWHSCYDESTEKNSQMVKIKS